ncbi:tetratricopeptide repeat protein [Geomicrobium sp. JCM 19055]|nr:tetratricopeptide repeat protein [Geomicrobium sp. JCM 19055]GAJ97585.1 hypothetical protein JCM19055_448 [Geomicrobium sp. JCM 19055]
MGQVVPFIQNPEYFFKQGVVAYQKKDWQRSIRYLQRAIDLRPRRGFSLSAGSRFIGYGAI